MLAVCGSDPDSWVARVYGNSWEQKRPSTFPPWLQPLETSGDSKKLCCLAGSAYMMDTQAGGGGHVIGACAQLKGVSEYSLLTHIPPIPGSHLCNHTSMRTHHT